MSDFRVARGGQELDQIEAGKRESSKPGSHSNANAHGMFLKVLTNWLPKLRIHSKAAPFLGSMTYRQRKYGLPLRVAGLRTGDIVQSCSTGLGLWGLRSAAKNAKRAGNLIDCLLRKKRQLTNYAERHAHGEWIASTRVKVLFGRSTDDGMTLPFRTENSTTIQTSRHELDRSQRPRRRDIRRKYQT